MSEQTPDGWRTDKFVVKHYRRGDLLDGEAFVLVPARDPAALAALRAYAKHTPDPELAERLRSWVTALDDNPSPEVAICDKIPAWVVTLAQEVETGRMNVTTALYRIAGYAMNDGGE